MNKSNYQQRLIIRHLFIEAYRPFNTPHSTFTIQQSLTFSETFPKISCGFENKVVTLR